MTDASEQLLARLDLLLMAIFRRLEQEVKREGQEGLSAAQCIMLATLLEKGQATMSELGNSIGITLGAATTMVDRLVAAGLVTRAHGTDDRRLVIVQPTARGLDMLMEEMKRRRHHMRKYMARLEAADLAAFEQILVKMAGIMGINIGGGSFGSERLAHLQ